MFWGKNISDWPGREKYDDLLRKNVNIRGKVGKKRKFSLYQGKKPSFLKIGRGAKI